MIFVVILGVICVTRIIGLCSRSSWRKGLDGEFPEACGPWALNGCTRVVLPATGCTRAESITYQNTIVLDTNLDLSLNKAIADCVPEISGAKLMYPDNLSSSKENSQLIHISVTSTFFGFLDDMYMWTEPIMVEGYSSPQRYIMLQS